MKCVCGYEYKCEWDSKPSKGDEEFKTMTVLGEMKQSHNWGHDTDEIKHRTLYICPKCGTVRFED